jgi:hypothetical protein
MTSEEFWTIVSRVHDASGGDMDEKCQLLREELNQLSDIDVRDFSHHLGDAADRAYSYGLWAAAYIIFGGCSDDSFDDFRHNIISCGRRTYETVVANPDSLADLAIDEDQIAFEGYQYVPTEVYQDKTGELPMRVTPLPSNPSGTAWKDEDLPPLCPKLYKRYWPNS